MPGSVSVVASCVLRPPSDEAFSGDGIARCLNEDSKHRTAVHHSGVLENVLFGKSELGPFADMVMQQIERSKRDLHGGGPV